MYGVLRVWGNRAVRGESNLLGLRNSFACLAPLGFSISIPDLRFYKAGDSTFGSQVAKTNTKFLKQMKNRKSLAHLFVSEIQNNVIRNLFCSPFPDMTVLPIGSILRLINCEMTKATGPSRFTYSLTPIILHV